MMLKGENSACTVAAACSRPSNVQSMTGSWELVEICKAFTAESSEIMGEGSVTQRLTQSAVKEWIQCLWLAWFDFAIVSLVFQACSSLPTAV